MRGQLLTVPELVRKAAVPVAGVHVPLVQLAHGLGATPSSQAARVPAVALGLHDVVIVERVNHQEARGYCGAVPQGSEAQMSEHRRIRTLLLEQVGRWHVREWSSPFSPMMHARSATSTMYPTSLSPGRLSRRAIRVRCLQVNESPRSPPRPAFHTCLLAITHHPSSTHSAQPFPPPPFCKPGSSKPGSRASRSRAVGLWKGTDL